MTKSLIALPLLALSLTACETYPPGPFEPGPPTTEGSYRAIGTEPFWDLTIGRDLVFTDRGNNVRVVQPTPRPINGIAGEIYQTPRINVNVVHTPCSDGMSDRTYPDTVQVRVDGREYRGCGAAVGFYSQVGDSGLPNPAPINLVGSNWRVAAINGRATPPSNYYVNFQPDRIQAKFGCNSIGSGYSLSGATLSAGALMMTRMACPDMSFENAGSRIMAQPMTVTGGGPTMTLSNRVGTIELVRAR
jgi:heat shock protein HslJ